MCDFGHVTTSQNLTFKIGVLVFTPGVVVRGICKALSVWYSINANCYCSISPATKTRNQSMREGRREREAEIKPQRLGGTEEGAVGWRACEVGGRTLGLPAWSSGYLGWEFLAVPAPGKLAAQAPGARDWEGVSPAHNQGRERL